MRMAGGKNNGRRDGLTRTAGVLGLGVAMFLPGCLHERYSYASTAHMPLTITMKNTTSGETVWSYDVPVGQQLNLTFQRDADLADTQGYDDMVWTVADIGKSEKAKSSRLRVPPPSERRLEMTVRSGNEPRTTQVIESERPDSTVANPAVGHGLYPRTGTPIQDVAPGNPGDPVVPAGAPARKPAAKTKEADKAPAIALPNPKQQAPK